MELGFIRSKKELLIMVSMAFFCFVNFLGFSCIAPFLPLETEKRGIDKTTTGMIFSVYPLVMVFVCPLVGVLSPKVGLRKTFLAGSFFLGINQLIFAFAADIKSDDGFVAYCFVFRILVALCASLSETTAYAILTIIFKDSVATVFGIAELFVGIGFMVGPVLGGGLYEIGGFRTPFLVIGGLALFFTIAVLFVLPKESELKAMTGETADNSGEVSMTKIITIPSVSLLVLVLVLAQSTISFLEPTLSYHLQDITDNGLSSLEIGLSFLLLTVLYALSTPIIGHFVDKGVPARSTVICGLGLLAIGILITGVPHNLTFIFPRKLWVVLVGLSVLGLGNAPLYGPLFLDITESAREDRIADCMKTTSIISGLFNGFYNIGSVVGPSLGGYLTNKYEFGIVCTGTSVALLAMMLVLSIFTAWRKYRHKVYGKIRSCVVKVHYIDDSEYFIL